MLRLPEMAQCVMVGSCALAMHQLNKVLDEQSHKA
jgi:hypothetical protein